MDKRRLHHYYAKTRGIGAWLFLAAAIVCFAVFIFAYRQNNLTMLQLRDRVTNVDKQNGDIETALRDLREYVHSHMNTDLTPTPDAISPPIQLKYEYERLLEAEQKRVAEVNDQMYSKAQAVCEQRYPDVATRRNRIPCVAEYVTQNGAKENPIPEDLYKFDFVSPRWSPDLAGWSLLAGMLFLALFAARLLLDIWVRHELD